MLVLVINSGSSSLKFQLLDMETEEVISKGVVERIGSRQKANITLQAKGLKVKEEQDIPNHRVAVARVVDGLLIGELRDRKSVV